MEKEFTNEEAKQISLIIGEEGCLSPKEQTLSKKTNTNLTPSPSKNSG